MAHSKYKPCKEYQAYLDGLPKEFYMAVLENNHNEIIVYDDKGKIVYVTPACIRHYGLKPEDMILRHNNDIYQGYWTPEGLTIAYSKKETVYLKQRFIQSDAEFYTIGVPILDENNNVKMAIGTVQEWPVSKWDVDCSDKGFSVNMKPDKHRMKRDTLASRCHGFVNLIKELRQITNSSIPILLLGESGSGKNYIAKYIHEYSNQEGPFLTLNCAAIPDTLLESELFGYAPGAFTGASNRGKVGLIEMAHNGTLFLDEIGDMPPSLQAKLLDVLENQRFLPVGSTKYKRVNTRLITATNKDIRKLLAEERFREDLYWRICTFQATIPPLRERVDDIMSLAIHFLNIANKRHNRNKEFSNNIILFFQGYSWPGNIRQLKNLVDYLVVATQTNEIDTCHLPEYMHKELENISSYHNESASYNERIDSLKREIIIKKYAEYPSTRKLAKALGISPSTAQRLIKRYCDPW